MQKENIDQNSKSTTITKHYNGTSLSIFQSPTEENPYSSWVWRSRKLIQPITFQNFRLPSSCVCVKNFLTPLQKRTMTSNLSPTLFLTTIDSHYRNLISDKVVRKLIQPIFGLHGLGTTPRGVIIKENLTFQQFFP